MKRLQRHHLNGLKAVESVGRLGTLQRAAEELGVSPGAVSQQVIRTEERLGRPVFSRTARGLVPTPFGAAFMAQLTGGFRTLDEALALADDDAPRALTVTVAPVLASKWLVARLGRFRAAHPDIRVRIDATTELVDLETSDVDLALRVGRGPWPGARLRRLLGHEVFPVCAPRLAATLKAPRDLASAPIIYDSGSWGSWDPWLRPHGLSERDLKPGDSFTDAALCFDAAIAGQGVMLAWQTLAVDALDAGMLVAPFAGRADTGQAYFIASAASRRETARMTAFIAWIEGEMAATEAAFARHGTDPAP